MVGEIEHSQLIELVGVTVIAFTGLAGTLWMGRLHRAALARCRRLGDDFVRTEEARERLKSFVADLVAALNLSLACYANESGVRHREEMERLRAALGDAFSDPAYESSPWGQTHHARIT